MCPGEWRGAGEQQLRACSNRARGVLHRVPMPDTPSQGTVKEALWGEGTEYNIEYKCKGLCNNFIIHNSVKQKISKYDAN